MSRKWYNLTPEQTAAILKTDLNTGLTQREAAKRTGREGRNNVYRLPRLNSITLIKQVLRDPSAFMLIIAAILAGIFEQRVSSGAIIALVILNWIGVIFSYTKARRIISDSAEYTIPCATVLRGGKQYIVKQDRVCRGDIIILNKGDVVPADARVTESNGLVMNEYSLTGEKAKKQKNPATVYGNNLAPSDQHDMVFATTVVSAGRGKAVVCRTGEDNIAAILDKTPTVAEDDKLEVLQSLKKHSSFWGMAMLILVFVFCTLSYIGIGNPRLFEVFITGLALAACGMCEYYVVFGYSVLGCGLYGILRKDKNERTGATIKHSRSIAALSQLSCVIVPKEGAFTSGSIRMERLWCDSTLLSATEKRLDRLCRDLISCALATTSYPENDYEKAFNAFKGKNVSSEERVILSCATRMGIFDLGYVGSHILLEHSESMGSGTVYKSLITDGKMNKLTIRGAIDDILPLCCDYRTNERAKSIKNEKKAIKNSAARMVNNGLCVVCVASKVTEAQSIEEARTGDDFVFEGFLAISEPTLHGAAENVERMNKAGIKVIMLCDETSVANRNYAKALNIITDESQIMTGAELRRTSDTLMGAYISTYRMYEGLDITQKRQLISYLHQSGESIGYFGNDYEDIALLHEADIGYSSGITLTRGDATVDLGSEQSPVFIRREEEKGEGSEALKQVCDVIVSPANRRGGGFNAIASSVAGSRRVISNLCVMMRYLITAQSARLFLVLYSMLCFGDGMVFNGKAILTPVQLLILGLVFDFIAVMMIAFNTNKNEIDAQNADSFFASVVLNNLRCVAMGALWAVIAVLTPLLLGLFGMEIPELHISAMTFYSYILTQLVLLVQTVSGTKSVILQAGSFNRVLLFDVILSIAVILTGGFASYVIDIPGTSGLRITEWIAVFLLPLVMFGVYELARYIHVFIREDINDNNTKN